MKIFLAIIQHFLINTLYDRYRSIDPPPSLWTGGTG